MTLDEYRLRLLDRLKACSGPAGARELVAEAQMVLAHSALTQRSLDQFWSGFRNDLQYLLEGAEALREREARATLGSAIAAAQGAIDQFHKPAADGSSSSGSLN